MFDFLKRKKPSLPPAQSTAMPPLYFKDNQSAFEFACQYLDCTIIEGSMLPAMVMDMKKECDTAESVQIRPDGNQIAFLVVASRDLGFMVPACTTTPKGPKLQPGQLVAWRAGQYSRKVAQAAKDKRFGWVGLIQGTLKPEYVDGAWVGAERFY